MKNRLANWLFREVVGYTGCPERSLGTLVVQRGRWVHWLFREVVWYTGCPERSLGTLVVQRGRWVHWLSREVVGYTGCPERSLGTLVVQRGRWVHWLSREVVGYAGYPERSLGRGEERFSGSVFHREQSRASAELSSPLAVPLACHRWWAGVEGVRSSTLHRHQTGRRGGQDHIRHHTCTVVCLATPAAPLFNINGDAEDFGVLECKELFCYSKC